MCLAVHASVALHLSECKLPELRGQAGNDADAVPCPLELPACPNGVCLPHIGLEAQLCMSCDSTEPGDAAFGLWTAQGKPEPCSSALQPCWMCRLQVAKYARMARVFQMSFHLVCRLGNIVEGSEASFSNRESHHGVSCWMQVWQLCGGE